MSASSVVGERQAYVSTSCVRGAHESLEALVQDYLSAGIRSIELGLGPPFRQKDLAGFLRQAGARFAIHNYFPAPAEPFVLNLASRTPDVRQRSMQLAERAIDLCAAIGAAFYSVHSGFRADFTPAALGGTLERDAVQDYESSYARFADALRTLARRAQAAGVGLLIEPNVVERHNLVEGRNDLLLIATADELSRLFTDVSEPALGVLLDTGHLNVTATTMGFNKNAFVDDIAPYIRAFHVHDNDGTADRHWPARHESWPMELVMESRFARIPVIVESKFGTAAEASAYVADLFSIEAGTRED